MKLRSLVFSLLVATFVPAFASAQQPSQRGFGLGVEALTIGVPAGAIDFVYDLGQLRLDAQFALAKGPDAQFGRDFWVGIGGRFHYVLHSTSQADFSLGFGALVIANDQAAQGVVSVLSQIRVFLVENVALQAALGMGLGFGRGSVTFAIGGMVMGSFGLVYFF